MNLARVQTTAGPRWAVDQRLLLRDFHLGTLLGMTRRQQKLYLESLVTGEPSEGALLAPIEAEQEVWASGVTYLRSREAREVESATGDIYQRVYSAERPELFIKAIGWRVVGNHAAIRVRRDSGWNVPEPELTLVLNRQGEIFGFTAGNDVSSRDIEGENPLYLPQAKVYNGGCALGPVIRLVESEDELRDIAIRLEILRAGNLIFHGDTNTSLMKRSFADLTSCLFRELDFPQGAFLLTGTGIVPPETYSLLPGDTVRVMVGDLQLVNITT